LQFLSPSSGWAVGDQGTILRFAPPANAAGSNRAGVPRQG